MIRCIKWLWIIPAAGLLIFVGCGEQEPQQAEDQTQEPAQKEIVNVGQETPPEDTVEEPDDTDQTADQDSGASRWISGKVKYVDLEGGFYLLRGDNGREYDPINLGPEFKKDGLNVRFRVKEAKDMVSFHMRGIIVEVISIEKIDGN